MVSPEVAQTTRTPSIASIEALAEKVSRVREAAAEQDGDGATRFFQVQTPQSRRLFEAGSVEQHRDHPGRLEQAGIDSFVLQVPGDSVEATIDALSAYADAHVRP